MSWLSDAPALGLQIGIASAWLILVGLLAAGLQRWAADPEVVRKAVHIGTGNIILLAWWLKIPAWVGMSASAVFSVVTILSLSLPILPGINSVGRKSLGTFFYAVSIGALIALFWQGYPQYAAIGILTMAWGDGLAALVGQRWGKHLYQVWGMQKSWEGSLTMGLASYAISTLVLLGVQGNCWQTWLIPAAVAFLAVGLEAVSTLGIDNLTVPLGSAIAAFFLNEGSMSILLRFWQRMG
ncbi:MAG: phosphatidate cytidylyltransferase [Leptolyngbyaceae cyanobacterium CRU_2_3]|nr:phosphatidate cytidylyltransferase [Leptolyngbyaceae cyanobacterium CRU_2_3]